MKPTSRTLWPLWAFLSALLCAPFAAGQGRDEYGEIRQTVARISYLSGEVSFSRGDDPDNWQPADRNVPMTLGDRIYTGSRSRVELADPRRRLRAPRRALRSGRAQPDR